MANPAPPAPPHSALAALLSYLVPGLGQIYQGRILKGLVFLVGIYFLFFYGMALGSWSNVFLPDARSANPNSSWPPLLQNFYSRPQFLGQFWAGVVAWPAVVQYAVYDPKDQTGPSPFRDWMRTPYEWRKEGPSRPQGTPDTPPAPADWPGKTLNELQTDGEKTWDLAWVYTVIAGVLNVLVIYDAYAGPAFGPAGKAQGKEATAKHAAAVPAAGR